MTSWGVVTVCSQLLTADHTRPLGPRKRSQTKFSLKSTPRKHCPIASATCFCCDYVRISLCDVMVTGASVYLANRSSLRTHQTDPSCRKTQRKDVDTQTCLKKKNFPLRQRTVVILPTANRIFIPGALVTLRHGYICLLDVVSVLTGNNYSVSSHMY